MELNIPNLHAALAALLNQIPRGRVTTYGRLADALGSRSAARWVGEFMVDHPHADDCCCHRVVRSTGEPGRYVGCRDDNGEKVRRLCEESIDVVEGRVDLPQFVFEDFDSDLPLKKLIDAQNRIPRLVSLTPFLGTPEVVAGVDVSYPSKDRAIGAYVLIETASGQVVWSATIEKSVTFPYIPGLLAFRELPVLLELWQEVDAVRRRAELIFVDGNGLLHPRRAGIATCFGVLTETPTVGVSKSLLLGSVNLSEMQPDERRPIVSGGDVLGMALKAKAMSRPIFVSPGHLIDIDNAVRLTRLLFHGHRLPEPIYQADAVSRHRGALRDDRGAGSNRSTMHNPEKEGY